MTETPLGFICSVSAEAADRSPSNLGIWGGIQVLDGEHTQSEKPTVSPGFSGLRDNRVVPTKRARDTLLASFVPTTTKGEKE